MRFCRCVAVALGLVLLASAPPTEATLKEGAVVVKSPPSVAPLKSGAVTTHVPYGTGECTLCHEKAKSGKGVGPAVKPVNKTCYFCHEDVQNIMTSAKFRHATAGESCTSCHNPHNSEYKSLLVAPMPGLCTNCHVAIRKQMGAKVKHDALTTPASCSACHSPHASNVEHVLLRLPFDQCVDCHSKDDLKDGNGKVLTNFKTFLAANPVQHAPVAQKDCSSCHETHGSDHTRLLIAPYPPEFYAPFAPGNYALCFTCHDEKMVTVKETTTETRFRNGSQNLHFAHVNKADKGRICRACHEVHAAKQAFLVREGVPYGSGGWVLKVGYTRTADGGTCEKTCHTATRYVNTAAPAPAAPAPGGRK